MQRSLKSWFNGIEDKVNTQETADNSIKSMMVVKIYLKHSCFKLHPFLRWIFNEDNNVFTKQFNNFVSLIGKKLSSKSNSFTMVIINKIILYDLNAFYCIFCFPFGKWTNSTIIRRATKYQLLISVHYACGATSLS